MRKVLTTIDSFSLISINFNFKLNGYDNVCKWNRELSPYDKHKERGVAACLKNDRERIPYICVSFIHLLPLSHRYDF